MSYGGRLDALNFLLADVRGELGPRFGVFLLTQAHWDPATIGAVLTVSGLIGITLHAPVGALIDATRHKRGLVVTGIAALAASALAIAHVPTLPVVLTADIAMAVLGAVFAPTVAAITVGLVRRHELAARLGRNAAFDRTGNIFIAGVAGLVGWAVSQQAVFYLTPLFGVLTATVMLSIPAVAIDHERARGLDKTETLHHEPPAKWSVLLWREPLLVLAVSMALFHFANAPLVPLLGQKLALAHPAEATMLVVGQHNHGAAGLDPDSSAGRGPSRPVGAQAAAARGVRGPAAAWATLHLSDHAAWLIAVQLLDGISLGALDALLALVLADVMRGTGRYNAARGLVGTVQGIGGSLSNAVAGWLVVRAGYDMTFLTLSAAALLAFLLVLIAMPETCEAGPRSAAHQTTA